MGDLAKSPERRERAAEILLVLHKAGPDAMDTLALAVAVFCDHRFHFKEEPERAHLP